MNKTGCECPLAGLCNRHGVEKTAHLHKLCQNHAGYFKMWEECRGPLQTDCGEKLPSLLKQAANVAKAVVTHVATGMSNATPEEKNRRLSICGGCPFFKEGRCTKCGCFLEVKTGFSSSKCPIGKW